MKEPEKIGGFLKSMLIDLGIWDQLKDTQIITEWEKIVGNSISEFVKPVRFENGELWVAVEDASWRNEIFNMRDALINKINDFMGEKTVKKLWLAK